MHTTAALVAHIDTAKQVDYEIYASVLDLPS